MERWRVYVREAGSLGNELGSYRCVMGLDARATQAHSASIAETRGIVPSVPALHGQQEYRCSLDGERCEYMV